ncbi:MAG: hypothetical protein ACE5F1_09105 [Planctomycetota bacterium]
MPIRPQLRAALLALLLGLLFLGPALLPGRTLLPQDPRGFSPFRERISQAERSRIDSEAVPHRRDKLFQFLPFDTAVGEAWSAGRVPLWEPRILCGIPLLAQSTSRAFYPTALLFALFPPAALYAWLYLAHLVLGGWAVYRLARILGAEEQGALLATAALVLSGYVVGHVHHPMIFFSAVWVLPALEQTWALLRPG